MDNFESLFDHLTQYRIILCKKCRFAPIPGQVRKHLASHHSHIPPEQRGVIVEKVSSLPDLAHVESEVVYPNSRSVPVAELPIYYDGLSCTGKDARGVLCRYVCRTARGIREHCRKEHGWVNQQKRGGDVRMKQTHSSNKLWKCDRACQRFFKVGSWQRYFEVEVNKNSSTHEDTDRKHNFFRQQEENIQRSKHDAAQKANQVQGFEDHLSTVVPWLRTTGIEEHIRGLKKDEIKAAVTLPSTDEESVLRTIVNDMDEILREAHSWCFDGPKCMLTWPCRVVLNRFQSSQVEMMGQTRAFDHHKEPGTLKAYFKTAKQFLTYFDRVAAGRDYYFSNTGNPEEEFSRPEDVMELTEEQRTAWHSIRRTARRRNEDNESSNDYNLKDELIRMWTLLIYQNTGARRYRSPLLSFCAMLSIRPTALCWMDPGDFNSHLSAIVWVVQLLIFYDSARRELQGEGSTIRLVKRCCERYLQQTNETPMGEILRWRLLLFRISKDNVRTRQATWDESEQVLTYEDTELHMDQIPMLLVSEYNECRRLLYQDLMFGATDIRRVHAWELKDNSDVHTVDWNFAQHRDNEPLLKGSEQVLLSTIEQSPHLCRTFLIESSDTAEGFSWRERALASYEATVQEFLKRLGTLIHISAGAPVRESEFLSMTWRNTQRPRSITLRHGRVMIHLTYHKSQQQSGQYRDNIRFLANPIAELLLDYIVYVTHLRQVFLRQGSPTRVLSPFLWEKNGQVWPESKLSRCLEEASVRAQIPRLHISNWRQMTVAIVKTKFASEIGCFEMDPDDEDAEELELDIRVLTKQRNHKTRTVNRAYANQTGATFGNVWDGLIRMGLRASTLWQNFWGVETILSDKRPLPNGNSRMVKRVAMGIFKPKKPWSTEALLGGLRKLYKNDDMQWRSPEQEQALVTIMSWTEQVVLVLPTGAGKTALVIVPCTLPEAGITIFVVPLVSLRGDFLRRVQELDIDYLEWLPGERREASLVVISIEAVSTKDFLIYAQSLVSQQKLDRIVVDECHLTVTAAEYRPRIVDLAAIRGLRTQFVYLTATLPPSIQAEFEDRNYLRRPTTIRCSSNRPNIFYMVRKAANKKGSLLQQAAAEVQDAWHKSELFNHAHDKIIVYVRTRNEATELSSLLKCNSYTAESGTAEEKKEILAKWIGSSDQPYIVATTALAEGFDYPYVRLVVNVNEPESLIVFAQESGRAGRDGQPAYSLVLLPTTWEPQSGTAQRLNVPASSAQDVSLRKQWERRAVHRYLRGEQCYRTSLSEYLDTLEQRRSCTREDFRCNVCKIGYSNAVKPVQDSVQDFVQEKVHTGFDLIHRKRLQEHLELVRYREDLTAVGGTCMLCRATDEQWDHKFSQCSRRHAVFEERSKARQRHEAKGRTWLQPFTACFWCLNPQAICRRAEERGRKSNNGCEYVDIVLPLCYGVFQSMQGPRWILEHFGRELLSIDQFFDWLGEESTFGGGRAIQGVRVAAKMLDQFGGSR